MMATKMRRDINPETMSRKMNRASTLPAMLEARCGHNGKLSNILRLTSCLMRLHVIPSFTRGDSLQAEENEDQGADEQDGQRAAHFQHVADDRAVFAGGGI